MVLARGLGSELSNEVMPFGLARGEWIWEGVEGPAISAKPSRSALTSAQA
jgi:hypothetical protein